MIALNLTSDLVQQIQQEGVKAYPNECCGLLVGTTDKDKNHTVHTFRKCKNLNQERARDRYDMDPLDMLRAEREFENSPWDIIGIYHSHPDHPSRASFGRESSYPCQLVGGTAACTREDSRINVKTHPIQY